ncbi:MAG: 5-formyltetrahydrofolate cyclo-ligase [bacterium]|nr:5-formyltetrahydrofolate cyclo-ligase [bacterium]
MFDVSKKTLRDTYLFKRKTLVKAEFDARNQSVLEHFQTLDNLSGKLVHVFLPIEKNYEVNTWPIVEYLKSIESSVIISKSNTHENTMQHFAFEDKKQLEQNKWGIPEPKSGKRVFSSEIDVVLIPFISFDRRGNRIGYGKGYYDRFLSECQPDVLKVGLSIIPPLDEILQADEHDIAMDLCVSHLGVYRFE